MHCASSTQPSQGGEDGFWIRMQGDSEAAARARREMARLQEGIEPPLLDDMRLLVTELVSNSVRHAGATSVELIVAVRPGDVRVEVVNPGAPFTPTTREARRQEDPGWGLFLLDRLSDDWGVLDESGYQRVWFRMTRN
jgi:anti-sigma regulatory factor (Ser/Thr protein kinase)